MFGILFRYGLGFGLCFVSRFWPNRAFFIFPLAAALRIPKMTLEAAPAVRLGRAIGVFRL